MNEEENDEKDLGDNPINLNAFFSVETIKQLCLDKIVNSQEDINDFFEKNEQVADFIIAMGALSIDPNFDGNTDHFTVAEEREFNKKITDAVNSMIETALLEHYENRGLIESFLDDDLNIVYEIISKKNGNREKGKEEEENEQE